MFIKALRISDTGVETRLIATTTLDGGGGGGSELWFSFPTTEKQAICCDIVDGFIYALLPWCLRNAESILSEVPITFETLWNVRALIDLLHAQNPQEYFKVEIQAPIAKREILSVLENQENKVLASASCGVDSMHTLFVLQSLLPPDWQISLVLNNTGSNHIPIYKDAGQSVCEGRKRLAERFCIENKYGYIYVNSNYHEFTGLRYCLTHLFVNMAIGHMLSRRYKRFVVSSGYDVTHVSFHGDVAGFENVAMEHFSTPYFSVVHAPMDRITRFQKIKDMLNYTPANKFLNVCFMSVENCGTCSKCRRVLLAIDALNSLDKFSRCFDLNKYFKSRERYLSMAYVDYIKGEYFVREMWNELRTKVKFRHKLRGLFAILKETILALYGWAIKLPGLRTLHALIRGRGVK